MASRQRRETLSTLDIGAAKTNPSFVPEPTETTIVKIRASLTEWMGEEPRAVLELVAPTGDEVAIAIFQDEDEDDDEPTTYLVTAGLARDATLEHPGVELVLCVVGEYDLEELDPLAKHLGGVALAALSQKAVLGPGAALDVGALPVFDGMSVLFLTTWSDSGELLPGIETPIALLAANPLYQEEAESLEGRSAADVLAWLDEQGIDVDDPMRPSAFEQGPDPLAALQGGSSFDVVQSMQQMMRGIEDWVSQNDPAMAEQLRALASGDPEAMAQFQAMLAGGGPTEDDVDTIDAPSDPETTDPKPLPPGKT
jgi:hypothetical protein